MENQIRIQLMDHFAIYVNDTMVDNLLGKSPKGAHFMQFLLLHRNESLPNYRLLDTLWNNEESLNPDNALKTMVSRLRATLNQVSPGLGECIVSDRGGYHWENGSSLSVDLYDLQDSLAELSRMKERGAKYKQLCEKVLSLYPGDLLQRDLDAKWAEALRKSLHGEYMNALYSYVEQLKLEGKQDEVITACRRGLDIDPYDDRLHMEMMAALLDTNRSSEAMAQYKHATHLDYQDLGQRPSYDMQRFYHRIVENGKTLDEHLTAIRDELKENEKQKGAFVCEYSVFKEIYKLEMRSLERLGCTIFLGVILMRTQGRGSGDTMRQSTLAATLMGVLKNGLRKGDAIAQVSPTVFAVLLPTVGYTTGTEIMERVKKEFYKLNPNSDIDYDYRIVPLTGEGAR